MATKTSNRRIPKLGRHSSGQARVTLNGKPFYVGLWGTLDAQKNYADLLAKWEANNRQPLTPTPTCVQTRKVRDLLDDYSTWLDSTRRYQKEGKPTSQRRLAKLALNEFAEHCGSVFATKLSDVLLRQHRDKLEARPELARYTINKKIGHVRNALRWARDRGMLTRDQWLGIAEIRPLSRHECGGREGRKSKRAVSPEDVEKVAQKAGPLVARMLRVQAAVGMRPGEVCAMRWCDLSTEPVDVDGTPCTIYTVAHPKNEHHGKAPTTYALPPRVVELLGTPTAPGAYVFPSPQKTGRGFFRGAYCNALARACVLANVPHFSPHELRHSFLTRAAAKFGVVAASAAANHSSTQITAGYVHADRIAGYRCVTGLLTDGTKTG